MTNNQKHLSDVLAEWGASGVAALSDEEWADRERRAQTAENRRKSARARRAWEKRAELLVQQGAPARTVQFALSAAFDSSAPGVEALAGWLPADDSAKPVRIIAGGVGVGKTVAAVRWLLERGGDRPTFIRANAFEAAGRYDSELRRRWQTCTAMVLDDIGCEYADAKGNLQSDVEELVDVFITGRVGLVMTTNLAWQTFEQRYGPRVWSRLKASARWHSVKGEDRRRA